MALTITPINRFRITKVDTKIYTMKKMEAPGICSIIGRAISAQSYSVMIWNRVNIV